MSRKIVCALLAACALHVGAHAQPAPESLNFGIISTESSNNLKGAWGPVIEDLSKTLGMPVQPFFASDYAGIIEAMRFNKVQVGWFGNKSAIEAVDRAQGEVFAAVIDKDGNPGYWSLLITHQDSDIKTVDDVIARGKDLDYGAGDPNSTSGTAVPGHYLWGARGIEPKSFFKTARAANHETNLMSVINKQVDVAINNTEALERFRISTGKDPQQLVRILWKSPLIPADPMVMRADLPADLKDKLRSFFVEYGKNGPDAERQRQNLAKLTYKGFRPSDNTQLIPIRQIELAKEKERIARDGSLAEDDKARKQAEIDARLAALDQQLSAAATDVRQ